MALSGRSAGRRAGSSRTIFIGDVHGMARELSALLARVQPTSFDRVVFLGDLIDKGPDSPGVVRLARTLASRIPVVLVLGNHEDKHARYRRNLVVRPDVALRQAQRQPELATITAGLSSADIAFLDSAVPFYRSPDHNLLAVHGGVIPSTTIPTTYKEARQLKGKAKRSFSKVLRTRYVDEAGKFMQLGEAQPHHKLWAESYDGRFGHIVFGHEPFMRGPGIFPHATGIDTGAVFGGALTALVVDSSGRHFVSVPSRQFAQWRDVR